MAAKVIPEVFVLGSGCSLGQLTQQEVDYITRAECVVALNKYMAFYKSLNILPTHVFFVDTHPGSARFLQHTFDVCVRDNLQGITYILHRNWRWRLSRFSLEQHLKKAMIRKLKREKDPLVFRVPRNSHFEFITRPLSTEGGMWASSLQQPLFHYRGTLTTALNYVSIKYPNRWVKLVGADLNSSQYFFQSELEKLDFQWQDWTTPIIQKEGLHFSAIEHKGTTMFDRFDYVVEQLGRTHNEIFNCNIESLLVTKGFTRYSPVISP